MSELWRIEDEVHGKNVEHRTVRRLKKSATIVARDLGLWKKGQGKVSGKSETAEAVR